MLFLYKDTTLPPEATTFRILEEIARILIPKGLLVFRVNTMPDYHMNQVGEKELEPHFYRTERGSYRGFLEIPTRRT